MPEDTTMTQSEKYRAFRNFMTNELGVGKEDIKLWVTESVEREVSKLVGQLNLTELVSKAISAKIYQSTRSNELQDLMRVEVGRLVAKQFKISIKQNDE